MAKDILDEHRADKEAASAGLLKVIDPIRIGVIQKAVFTFIDRAFAANKKNEIQTTRAGIDPLCDVRINNDEYNEVVMELELHAWEAVDCAGAAERAVEVARNLSINDEETLILVRQFGLLVAVHTTEVAVENIRDRQKSFNAFRIAASSNDDTDTDDLPE